MAGPSLLFDSNVFYAAINISPHGFHRDAEIASRLLELARKHDCDVFLAKATEVDINRASNPLGRKASHLMMRQWKVLGNVAASPEFLEAAGYAPPLGPGDTVDSQVLATLAANAADFLVTQDRRLREHARRAGLGERVVGIQGAIELLEQLFGKLVEFPLLTAVKGYQLDVTDPIFDSLREDYDGFDDWLEDKVRRGHRDCLVVQTSPDGPVDALAILKSENDRPYDLDGEVLKVCTFKVADHAAGAKRGELLLKAVLSYADTGSYDSAYVEVFPEHESLIQFLGQFGFQDTGHRKPASGELVLAKTLRPPASVGDMPPLTYNQLYGPPAVLLRDAFVVPIRPVWHDTLFPESRHQLQLTPPSAAGNALRKAYLSGSAITKMTEGSTVFFYRSSDAQAVTAVGVVDDTLRSSDPEELRRFVGQRTVYTDAQIRELCEDGAKPVLAILFRHDRVLEEPWPLSQLTQQQIVTAPPQTIQQITDEGALAWIEQQLAAPR